MKSQASVASEALSADRAAIDKARASLVLDQGTLNAANLQLSYCSIYSPIDGRTGPLCKRRQFVESLGCADRRHQSGQPD
jgi:hypothetical protein